jgi:hypothetical protein
MQAGLSGDVFFQVAAGRWMLAHHDVLRHDVFSYTVAGRHWLDEEWGFQVLLAWLVGHLGAVSYWLVSAGAGVVTVLVALAHWKHNGAGWLWAAALSILAAAGLSVALAPRPQDLSYLFFSVLLFFLALARRRSAWLAAVPPLLLVWANVHGSFLLGLGILVLELAWSVLPSPKGRVRISQRFPPRTMVLTLVAASGATLVNPNGPALVAYAFHVSTSSQLSVLITEWQSPDFHSLLLLGVIIGPVLLLTGLLAFTETVFELGDVALGGLLFLAALHAVRFTPYFVLAACLVLARWSPIRRETIRPSLFTVPLAALLVVVLLAGAHVPAGAPQQGGGPLGTPVAAVDFLKHQTGRVFTTYWWSDYLIYEHVPVFVDGRTDLYFGTDILGTYKDVSALTVDPGPVFSRWDVRWVMWDKRDALSTYLSHDPGWKLAHQAGDAMVFEHIGHW